MNISFLVLDVDGTLTDSKVYVGNNGELFKAFDIKDGCGLKEILPKYGIIPIIITARESNVLTNRCLELGITELYQGCRNKLDQLRKILNNKFGVYNLANVAYMGDDLLDLEPMVAVKEAGGMAVCPNNAIDKIKDSADYISIHNAGEGALREFIDWLTEINEETKISLIKNFSQTASNFIDDIFTKHLIDASYNLDNGIIANVMSYITKPALLTMYESHKKYIDVQYMIYGEELLLIEETDIIKKYISKEYEETTDITNFNYNLGKCIKFKAGDVIILYPENAHRGAIVVDYPRKVRKVVFKIPIHTTQL